MRVASPRRCSSLHSFSCWSPLQVATEIKRRQRAPDCIPFTVGRQPSYPRSGRRSTRCYSSLHSFVSRHAPRRVVHGTALVRAPACIPFSCRSPTAVADHPLERSDMRLQPTFLFSVDRHARRADLKEFIMVQLQPAFLFLFLLIATMRRPSQ